MIKPLGILIIFLFVVTVGGILVWQFWSGGETPSPAPLAPTPAPANETVDETADWQTYTSQEFGYEIKYPNSYYVIDESPDNIVFRNEKYRDNPSSGCEFLVSANPNPSKKNLEEWFVDNSTEAEFGTTAYQEGGKLYFNSKQAQLEKIVVGGQDALKFYQVGAYPNDWIDILVQNGAYMIEIVYFPNCSELDTFNQILSTFKFID